jgi:transcription elongation factor Elf1
MRHFAQIQCIKKMSAEEATSTNTTQNAPMSQKWRELAESRGFEWPTDPDLKKDLELAMDCQDGQEMIKRYLSMSQAKRSARVKESGMIRLSLFLILSLKLNFMSPRQYITAREHIDELFSVPEKGAAFFFQYLTESEGVLRANVKAMQIERKKIGKETAEGEEAETIAVSRDSMSKAFDEMRVVAPSWVIGFLVFAQNSAEALDLVDFAKSFVVASMDISVDHCSLSDIDMAIRGISVMDVFDKSEGDDPIRKIAEASSRHVNMGVRESARLSYYHAKQIDSKKSFGKSFNELVVYILCKTPPNITRKDEARFTYTELGLLGLSRKLRRAKKAARKQKAITIPEHVARVMSEMALSGQDGRPAYKPGDLYDLLSVVNKECAIGWLHCQMCGSENVIDWWWFMKGATVYSDFRANERALKEMNKDIQPTETGASSTSEDGEDEVPMAAESSGDAN